MPTEKPPLRLLIACRLMSGFTESILKGEWNPSGGTAFYQLINRVDQAKDIQLSLCFLIKEKGGMLSVIKKKSIKKLTGLNTVIEIVPGPVIFPSIFSKFFSHLTEFYHAFFLFFKVRKERPDVVYIDRSNVMAATLISRFSKIPVILRVLGVTPSMNLLLEKLAISHYFYRFCYRSPFAWVICSMDGSSADKWMERALSPRVMRKKLLNGVDGTDSSHSSLVKENSKITLTILGRLDPIKNAHLIVSSLLELSESFKERIRVQLIGEGILREALVQQVREKGWLENFYFLGAVPHEEAVKYLRNSDIYISLNSQGNLSNANLEAIKAGLCLIMLEADSRTGVDKDSYDILPEGSAVRINRENIQPSLLKSLEDLLGHPEKISAYKEKTKMAAMRLLSWDQRIAQEISLIKAVSSTEKEKECVVSIDN